MELEFPDDAEDLRVENAPVRRHLHAGMTIEGWSRAAMQSYWRVPELKIGFDFGLQPWSFMTTPMWALSHTHLDHVAAMPAYVSRRRLMKMPEPVIFMPNSAVEDVLDMLRCFQRLDRGRMPCRIVGMDHGEEYDLSREHVLSTFATTHTIPSLGYIVWERRKKLKPEYLGLPNDRIRDLRLAGTEVAEEVRTPLVAYLGDSSPEGLDACPDAFRAKVLILEMTFLAPGHRREHIHKYGHMHLDDIVERAGKFRNELVIASHFSTRYHDDHIRRLADKALPPALREKLILWL